MFSARRLRTLSIRAPVGRVICRAIEMQSKKFIPRQVGSAYSDNEANSTLPLVLRKIFKIEIKIGLMLRNVNRYHRAEELL